VETLNSLLYGFSISFQPMNLLFCFLGVLAGTLVGVLPGLGPPAAICLLLPMTFHLTPVGRSLCSRAYIMERCTAGPPLPSWSIYREKQLPS